MALALTIGGGASGARARWWGVYQREALGETNGDSEQYAGKSREDSKCNPGDSWCSPCRFILNQNFEKKGARVKLGLTRSRGRFGSGTTRSMSRVCR